MSASPEQTLTLCVPPSACGLRLDVFLSRIASASVPAADVPSAHSGEDAPAGQADALMRLNAMSRSRLQQLINNGDVRVAGVAARPALKLKAGQSIGLCIPAPVPSALTPTPMVLDIIHEDADLLVVNKPVGLVVHPGAGHATATLVHGLLAHCRDLSGIGGVLRPGIVHRLDAGTSGLMVVAKHDAAHTGLAQQFAARTVTKRYVAVVFGTPTPREATIDTWYARHPTQRCRFTSRVAGPPPAAAGDTATSAGIRRARTTYRVLREGAGIAVLDVLLGTGRTHQIRVHLSDRGHPLVGDLLYGGRQYPRITSPDIRRAAMALPSQALHAASLRFAHPLTNAPMSFYAPPPGLLVDLYQALAHPDAR